MEHFDVVIVGGGSSGCALAGRLSENSDRNILLLEAGPDYQAASDFPKEIVDFRSEGVARPGQPYNWSFSGTLPGGRSYPVPRGKIIGGCSAINGAYFIRGTNTDFDRWERLGNPEWSYDNVLPVFRRLEDDADFGGELHGKGGPVPVRRDFASRSHPMTNALFEAAFATGFPEQVDKNVPGALGIGLIPRNVVDRHRINAALSYLAPHRNRKNLAIRGGHFVRKILFEGTRAAGVEVEHRGQTINIYGDEIVLSTGAIKSPHLLMLSGIGPALELTKYDIRVVHHSPGVGKHFMDHAKLPVTYRPTANFPIAPTSVARHVCLNFTATDSPYVGDIEITNRVGATTEGEDQFVIGLHQPEGRGDMLITSSDPHTQPIICYKSMTTELDLSRMRSAIAVAVELLRTQPLRELVAKRIEPLDEHLSSAESLNRWILSKITMAHTSASCHMGPETDDAAVVDQCCRVRGVEQLRVVDTSIMPCITSYGTSATALMIGERAADLFADS